MRMRLKRTSPTRLLGPVAALATGFTGGAGAGTIAPEHVVVVIEENHDYNQIIASPDAPYINHLADNGLSFLYSHSLALNSLVNYLDLFSGSNQGVTDDTDARFAAPNLASSLMATGRRFVGYAEGMPSDGFTGAAAPDYVRIHNPWTYFGNLFTNGSNAAVNKVFNSTNFPTAAGTDYGFLPDVAFVVPNLLNDMHGEDGSPLSDSQLVSRGDSWLRDNLGAYAQWAQTHRSLLMVTWDENDYVGTVNHIPTIIAGDPSLVHPGLSGQPVNHFSLLRTIEDLYGLPALGGSATADGFTTDATGALVPKPALRLGDADGDGVVNFADLLVLARHYGDTNASFAEGDFNGDGAVDFNDLLTLSQNYDPQGALTALPVPAPEPAAIGFLLAGPFALVPRRRRVTSTRTSPTH